MLIALAALTVPARADHAADRAAEFQAAETMRARGEAAAAVAAYEALAGIGAAADAAPPPPDDPWVDDALLEAAELREDALGDPVGALALYRRILSEFPDERAARRARARASALSAALGSGGAWAAQVAEEQAILRLPRERTAEGIARMQALVAANPQMPRAGDALLWIAGAWLREGRTDDALAGYRRAELRADPARAGTARYGEAEVLLAQGALDEAEAGFRALAAEARNAAGDGDAGRIAAAEAGLDKVALARERRLRARLAWAVLAAATLFLLVSLRRASGSWRASVRVLRVPPVEVIFLVPVAGLLALLAVRGHPLIAGAIERILAGGIAVAWLSAAVADAHRRRAPRPSPARFAVHLVAVMALLGAIGYLALSQDELPELLRETWQHGHDR